MPRWSGPPIPTKGVAFESNLGPTLAITTSWMRRFGASKDEIEKLREDVLHSGSYEKGCDFIRQYFPLDTDLLIFNNCPHKNCLYPGCPRSCDGRTKVKVKTRSVTRGDR